MATTPWNSYSNAIGYRTPARTNAASNPFHMQPISALASAPNASRQVMGGSPIGTDGSMQAPSFQSFFQRQQTGQNQSWLDNPLRNISTTPAVGSQGTPQGSLSPLQQFLNNQTYGQTPVTQTHTKTPTTTGNIPMPSGTMGGALSGNKVVDIAKSYVGKVSYHLGAKPSASNDNPSQWDCSGFINWLDKRYGNGKLPGGAHYQFQYAQQNGKLFTDMSQLRPGDIIFLDTGFKGGSGANLNNASHVVMYAGDGMIVHATYGSQGKGTVLSKMSAYPAIGKPILGAMHMSWSG